MALLAGSRPAGNKLARPLEVRWETLPSSAGGGRFENRSTVRMCTVVYAAAIIAGAVLLARRNTQPATMDDASVPHVQADKLLQEFQSLVEVQTSLAKAQAERGVESKVEVSPEKLPTTPITPQPLRRLRKGNKTNEILPVAAPRREFGEEFLTALGQRAQVVAPGMNAMQVVNVLRAYSVLWLPPQDSLLSALGARAEQVVEDMGASDVVSVVGTYAHLNAQPADSLLMALEKRALKTITDMKAEDVFHVLGAYVTLNKKPNAKFLQALGKQAESVMEEMSAEGVVTIFGAFTEFNEKPSLELVKALVQRMETVAVGMSAKDVAKTLQAYQKFDLHDELTKEVSNDSPLDPLWHRAMDVIGDMDEEDVATVIPAYAKFQNPVFRNITNGTKISALANRTTTNSSIAGNASNASNVSASTTVTATSAGTTTIPGSTTTMTPTTTSRKMIAVSRPSSLHKHHWHDLAPTTEGQKTTATESTTATSTAASTTTTSTEPKAKLGKSLAPPTLSDDTMPSPLVPKHRNMSHDNESVAGSAGETSSPNRSALVPNNMLGGHATGVEMKTPEASEAPAGGPGGPPLTGDNTTAITGSRPIHINFPGHHLSTPNATMPWAGHVRGAGALNSSRVPGALLPAGNSSAAEAAGMPSVLNASTNGDDALGAAHRHDVSPVPLPVN